MENKYIWQKWAENLRRWHLSDFAAWFFDSASPAHLLGAQVVYIGQPLLEVFIPQVQFNALTEILEKPSQAQAFVTCLREDH
jgi:hypothetical protein